MSEHRIYFSQLINDNDIRSIVENTGCGIELVDFSMASVLDDPDRHIASWQKKLEAIKPPYLSSHGAFLDLNPMSWDSLIAEATMRRFEQSYRAASILGADTVVFHSCFVPNFNFLQGWPKRVIDFYNRFLENKDDRVRVVMENVMDPVPDGFLEVAEGIDHPAFGICVDIGHAHCYSKCSVRDWFTSLSSHIRHVHISDNDGTKDSHLALGSGTLDFNGIIELIPQSATFTVECSRPDDILQSISILKRI